MTMPSGRAFYERSPQRYAIQKEKFRQLIAELKRLALKKGYSQEQIASEIGVTKVTVNHWCTEYSLTAKERKHRAAQNLSGDSLSHGPLFWRIPPTQVVRVPCWIVRTDYVSPSAKRGWHSLSPEEDGQGSEADEWKG
jgi:transcriptional regulator with XRE-family HTH domain